MATLKKILNDINEWCDDNDCSLVLIDSAYIKEDDSQYSGMFDASSREIVVAVGMSPKKYIPILLHEWCHAIQFLEDKEWFTEKMKSVDIFFKAISSCTVKDLPESVVKDCVDLEVDCESRTHQLLIDYDIKWAIKNYVKKANSYVMAYWYIHKIFGEWIGGRLATYNRTKCWNKFPAHFLKSYSFDKCSEYMISYHYILTEKTHSL